MNKVLHFVILIAALLFSDRSAAQQPDEALTRWSLRHPIEKIFIHFDREEYTAGETVWFKAYLSSEYMPDTISTNLLVEFSGPASDVRQRLVLPVLIGTSAGHWDIPDTLQTGLYTVSAFTPSMATHAPDFIFKKGIWIHGKNLKQPAPKTDTSFQIRFFPEGGNLVSGLTSTVAFKASYSNGIPSGVTGKLYNQNGEEILSFRDQHDGMGTFELTPGAGDRYTAVITTPVSSRSELPAVLNKGVVLSVIPHPRGSYFELQQTGADSDFESAYMIGQMQHRVVFRHEFSSGKNNFQGVIDTRHLYSGILQLTVFNKKGMPLAERIIFVNNGEYLQPVTFAEDSVSTLPRGRNRFLVMMPDTIQGNISIAVTDADFERSESRDENIISTMLLTSDLPGYVHRPAYYLSGNNDAVRMATDLLMMTQGWRRFKWTEIPGPEQAADTGMAFIRLEGKATLRGTSKPFANKALLLLINDVGGKVRNSQMLQTGADGSFLIDSLIFFDKKLLLFSDVRGKKSQYIDVKLGEYSLQQEFKWPSTVTVPDRYKPDARANSWQSVYDELMKAKGLMLEEITIDVKLKSPSQVIDERYTRGMFSGEATHMIDLVNNDAALPYNNIFDYLQARVNGLSIVQDGPDYGIFYRQGPSISSMGNIPMTLFLNEIETDASVIATIPANQVALVKLYNVFAGAWGNAPGGVLAIYTRKGKDYQGNAGRANTLYYEGYSVVKEFYEPDSVSRLKAELPDRRITLDWRPAIFINHINPRIPFSFYNNDRTKRFRITVAGMTAAGKLIWLEKTVQGE